MRVSYRTFHRSRVAARLALVACLAGVLAMGTAAVAQAPTTGPSYSLTKANFGIAPGAGFFINNPDLTRSLNDFKTLGVRWIRSVIPWHNFEPDDPTTLASGASKWNWKGVDAFVATMHNPAYNGAFNLIVNIGGVPAWATQPSHIAPINCPIQAPFDLNAYAAAAAALAQHLQGTANVFELENSPNIGVLSAAHGSVTGDWPVPNPCGYTQLLKFTTPAVHALRPDATVLVGGIGGTQDVAGERMAADTFLNALYVNGARGSFDGVSYHPYSTPYLPCAPTALVCTYDPSTLSATKDPYDTTNGWDRMLNARSIMVANGDDLKQIWITEFGGPTKGRTGKNVLTQAQQAALLTAGFDRASQDPWVAEMCWFTYQDAPGADPATSPMGDWMGLVNGDFSHKLSFATYQNLTATAQ